MKKPNNPKSNTPANASGANPSITRRTFINRTTAAGAATVFGISMAVQQSFAEVVTGSDGFLVDYNGDSRKTGAGFATAAVAWADMKAFLQSQGATIAVHLITYDNYYFELVPKNPVLILNADPSGSAVINLDADGTYSYVVDGPTSFQAQTHKLVQIQQ